MQSEVRLHSFDKSMLDESVDLFMDTFSKEPWCDVYESRDQVVTYFENYMNNNYFLGYVLKYKNEIAGISFGSKKPWIEGMEFYIDEFCISEKYQGKGLGSKFFELIEADMKDKGLNAIILLTNRTYPAEKFYLQNGCKKLEDMVVIVK